MHCDVSSTPRATIYHPGGHPCSRRCGVRSGSSWVAKQWDSEVDPLWKVAIVTNMSCDGAHSAFQIRKLLSTLFFRKVHKNHFKKLCQESMVSQTILLQAEKDRGWKFVTEDFAATRTLKCRQFACTCTFRNKRETPKINVLCSVVCDAIFTNVALKSPSFF